MKSNVSLKALMGGMILMFSLLLGGCHGTHHYDSYASNTLVMQNDIDAIGDVWYAYVTPSESTSWGEDLLGNGILQPGDDLVLDVYECNRYYDIRIEYDNAGPVVEQYDVWLPCDTTTVMTFSDW